MNHVGQSLIFKAEQLNNPDPTYLTLLQPQDAKTGPGGLGM